MKSLVILLLAAGLLGYGMADVVYRDVTAGDLSNGWNMRTFTGAIGTESLEVAEGISPDDGAFVLQIAGLEPNTVYTDVSVFSFASTANTNDIGVDVTYQGSDGAVSMEFLSSSGTQVDNSNGGVGVPMSTSSRWVNAVPDFLTDAFGIASFTFVPATIAEPVQRSYIDGIAYNNPAIVIGQTGTLALSDAEYLVVAEGGVNGNSEYDHFGVSLSLPVSPGNTVTVMLTENNSPADLELITPSVIVFDSTNWNQAVSVEIKALDDNEIEPGVVHLTEISCTLSGDDPSYLLAENAVVQVHVIENECGAFGYNRFDVTGAAGASDCIVNLFDLAEFAAEWAI